ncbi:hypothetical protein CONPUDRAFT_74844 [Coniophora puteana RWD-64-598 SS2]|uniref:Methylated-DNA-[protein]-cysteine S-methyltransferase DNA binding domain-containing protein n=1 Tax=Coniophora puteana (strain RWD-64-598) TaxID=741705 RepID=A0A5M3MK09_CONPW|nr:uncharacterized protein CONPUDRAFT_74844 [Coniophora puteana RWD-64-598 SS2]EIW79396.1 hypothetical protein CONPUDRAFT_74844 [Coniophora puteana RWD-64-598 SS2]
MRTNVEEFNLAVFGIIQLIPAQRVITCGHIANLIGMPKAARRVKEAVNFISHTTPPVPCHRVISTSGVVSTHGACPQSRALEADGISVSTGCVGELRVQVDKYGWFPDAKTLQAVRYCRPECATEWGS